MTQRDRPIITEFVIIFQSGEIQQLREGDKKQQALIKDGLAVKVKGESPHMALLTKVKNLQTEVHLLEGRIDQQLANAEAGSHTPG